MLLRQTLLYLPAQISVPLAQVAAAFAWTHWLAPEQLGAYAVIWAAQELAYLLTLSGWSAYLLRYASAHAGPDEAYRLAQTDLAVLGATSVLQALAALGATWLILPEVMSLGLAGAVLAFTVTRGLITHLSSVARANFDVAGYSLLQASGSFGGLVLGVAAVETWQATPGALLYAYALAQAAGGWFYYLLRRPRTLRPRFDPVLASQALRYGAPLMLAGVFLWFANHGIRVIVDVASGAAAVGLMTVGWWLGLRLTAMAAMMVTGGAFSVSVEAVRTSGWTGALPQFAASSAMLLGILVPAVAGAWYLGPGLIAWLVAEPYRSATADILPAALLAGALRSYRDHGTDQVFLLAEQTRYAVMCSGFEAVLVLVLCWLGLVYGGVMGAAIGCALAAGLAAALSFAAARFKFGYYVNWGDLARIGVASGLMLGALALLGRPVSPIEIVTAASVGGLVYASAAAILFPEVSSPILRAAGRRMNWLQRF